jgi:two-component system NtrC family sensor kinase
MIAVAGVFYYVNRPVKRQYLTLWMMAWIFYAAHLLAAIALQLYPGAWPLILARRAFIGVCGLFMLWGSLHLDSRPRSHRELGLAIALVLTCCCVASYALKYSVWLTILVFGFLGSCEIYAGRIYLTRRAHHNGATVLGCGFIFWGSLLLLFPLLELSASWMAVSYLVSAGLAVTMAIAMATVAEREVNVAERSYRLLFDASSDAVFLVDMWKLNVLEANRAAERLTKYTGDALRGLSFRKICPALDRRAGNLLENHRAFNAIFRPYEEIQLLQHGGKQIACEGEVAFAEWHQRMVFQVNLREIGEKRRLEEQVQRAEKLSALGQLVAGVAHELNNPLAIIMGSTQLLAGSDNLDNLTKETLGRILRQSERASRIIRDLLAYSRPSQPNKAPIDLNRVVRDVLEWRRPNYEAAQVSVRAALADSLPYTKADRVQVEQVVMNLVNNAVDALREHPLPREVVVTTQETSNFLRVSVRDNGPGMTPEILKKIFNPFFTTKPIGRGTGLGLAICNTYIQEHRGKMWVESQPGEGTTFFFDLPLLDCEGQAPAEPEALATEPAVSAKPATPTGLRLLIVDDEPDIADLLEAILAGSGYNIQKASNGIDGLQLLTNEDFDAVVSDMLMPGLDGRALYYHVQQIKPDLAKRMIFVTGDTLNSTTREFLKTTGNLFLSKPFKIDEVTRRVHEAIQRGEVEEAPDPGELVAAESVAQPLQ